jgi:hypothetical protein
VLTSRCRLQELYSKFGKNINLEDNPEEDD